MHLCFFPVADNVRETLEATGKIYGKNCGTDTRRQVALGGDRVEAQTNAGTRQPRWSYMQPLVWSSGVPGATMAQMNTRTRQQGVLLAVCPFPLFQI